MKKTIKIVISSLAFISISSSIVPTISCSKSEEFSPVVPATDEKLFNNKYGMSFNSLGILLDYPKIKTFNVVIPPKLDVDDPESKYYRYEREIDTIGDNAFKDKAITSVEIPNTVIEIRYWAFANTQLTNVIIPDSVTSIGDKAFANTPLTGVVLSDSLTYLNGFNSTKLTSIDIPNSVKIIGTAAFKDTPLTHVTIPDSVKQIWNDAFTGTKITQVTLPPYCEYEFDSFPPGTKITGGIKV